MWAANRLFIFPGHCPVFCVFTETILRPGDCEGWNVGATQRINDTGHPLGRYLSAASS